MEKYEGEKEVKEFVLDDDEMIKWNRSLRRNADSGNKISFNEEYIIESEYKPFTKKKLYFGPDLVYLRGIFPRALPLKKDTRENKVLCTVTEKQLSFSAQATNLPPALHYGGRQTQCFPLFLYESDNNEKKENITDWALENFQSQYRDMSIGKIDIFNYVYSILHHPSYLSRYEDVLRDKMPHIPHVSSSDVFWSLVSAGENLVDLHIGYESVEPYDLEEIENKNADYEWRVEKMKFTDDAQTVLKYNDFLSLHGIPQRSHDYLIGNKSALEWLVDQYRVRTYNRYDITHDPNDPDDKWYIVDLIKRVTTVSVKTVDIVNNLPDLGLPED